MMRRRRSPRVGPVTTSRDSEVNPLERVEDLDLPRILKAMRQAVREALLQHKLLGHPIAVCRDERVVWLAPEDIPVDFDDGPDEPDRAPPPSAGAEGRASMAVDAGKDRRPPGGGVQGGSGWDSPPDGQSPRP